MAMLELLRGMRRKDGEPWSDRQGNSEVPHGFRSSFRDWAAERTCYPREAIEMSLAIRLRQAYRRGDLFEKRRRWASGRSSARLLGQQATVAWCVCALASLRWGGSG
jgi:hypothetical protein